MNVSLAAQTLSSSVAAAIDFLRKESQVENFAGSEATTDFIRKVDLAFDLLKSRNPLAKGTWSISIPKHVRTFFDHTIGEEYDHVTSLLRLVVQKYLNMRQKTYAKKYSEMIVHKNMPSTRHQLTKLILFRNQSTEDSNFELQYFSSKLR